MAQVVISAKLASGYYHLGRKWGHNETVELVDQPADEVVSDSDGFDAKIEKQKKAHARVAAGAVTQREIDIMNRDHVHALAVASPAGPDPETLALKARVAELEALLSESTAPKKAK